MKSILLFITHLRPAGRLGAHRPMVQARMLSDDSSSSIESTPSSASSGDSIHSSDIAFKPAESGWGAGKKYLNNYDSIFGSKKQEQQQGRGEQTTRSKGDSASS